MKLFGCGELFRAFVCKIIKDIKKTVKKFRLKGGTADAADSGFVGTQSLPPSCLGEDSRKSGRRFRKSRRRKV